MPLPPDLRSRIEQLLDNVDRSRVARAAEQITADYRSGRFGRSLQSAEARVAYLLTRLPATFAANQYVFAEISRIQPEFEPNDILDLGTGPGTAMWAARDVWPGLAEFTMIDSNPEMLRLGQQLSPDLANAKWNFSSLSNSDLPPADLVVISYALGELSSPANLAERAWNAARKVLVIIEPGTPKNFFLVDSTRKQLIKSGAHPIAPCPHSDQCPMAAQSDWCHFSVRVERTSEHRRLKGGALGYEDEKFSYLAFSKTPVLTPPARIVRHPAIRNGHIQLTLCTNAGLQSTTVTRSDKTAFRDARRAGWGDTWG